MKQIISEILGIPKVACVETNFQLLSGAVAQFDFILKDPLSNQLKKLFF